MGNTAYDAPVERIGYDYNSLTENVRASITTRWGKSGYQPRVIRRSIQSYYVDTALDNDADPWSLEITDPNGDLFDCLKRDNEVRVRIFGVGSKLTGIPMLTGVADDVDYGDDGVMKFTGRDYTSLAIDSALPPGQFRNVQAFKIVDKQARAIGFTRTQLAKMGPEGRIVKKLQETDGSETYWQFWHRLYRKEKLWIWTEPEGTLIASKLNYSNRPRYYFGVARRKDPRNIQRQYIPVQGYTAHKTTQSRLAEVWVYGHKGDNGIFSKPQIDPTMKGWIKRPRKIMMDTDARTIREVVKTAWDEIFEGKVGAVEFSITISDPGFPIEQNTVCVLNLEDPDIQGEFFIVGVRTQASSEGFIQEIRLREKQYAISRRVPDDIKIKISRQERDPAVATLFEDALGSITGVPDDWGPYFVKATNQHHGHWDYNLFLATLLAIADQETAFKNIRSYGGPGNGDHVEWYPWKPTVTQRRVTDPSGGNPRVVPGQGNVDENGRTKQEWERIFANEPGAYTGSTWAVGPMQLYSLSFKEDADHLLTPGQENEFGGGRWHPEFNIMIAAQTLRVKLRAANADSGREIDMWNGVSLYGHNAHLWRPGTPTPYAISVKNKVYNDPGYKKSVKDIRDEEREAVASGTLRSPVYTDDPGDTKNPPVGGFNNSALSLAQLTNVKAAPGVDIQHVNPELLRRLNSFCVRKGVSALVTSGFRSYKHQKDLWNIYVASGYNESHLAANPDKGKGSNHMRGQAIDVTIGGVYIGVKFSNAEMAPFGIWCGVPPAGHRDLVHISLTSVSG